MSSALAGIPRRRLLAIRLPDGLPHGLPALAASKSGAQKCILGGFLMLSKR